MSRVPKWLLLKEWLSYEDIIRLVDNAPSSIENVLSQDCSEEFGLIFRFICTFCPKVCQKEFKEYRFENVARTSIRTHLKDHINHLKEKGTEDDKREFSTKNQLYRGTKSVAVKHKTSMKSEVPKKKVKRSMKNEKETGRRDKSKLPKRSGVNRFTVLKNSSKDSASSSAEESQEQEEETENQIKMETVTVEEEVKTETADKDVKQAEAEDVLDRKSGNCYLNEADVSEKISCETQTEQNGKEQETFQYKVATKLFAVDRSLWNNIETVLDDIVNSEKPPEVLSQQDREKILIGMRQWIESVQIYDNQTLSRLQDPLTKAEKSLLEGLTSEDWKRLDAAQDSESKLRLTVYARMLLRDYECYPRKLKPKHCRHCGKHYTASTSLYSHLVSLSGIRFWVCSKCKDANKEEATFTRKHSLQYHILKEVGIPRYRCTQPGCSKTHNHTHHQKSHARQHTGEKHYICIVKECKGRFSNRNTYSRHLLQFHSMELTRNNQLRAIDEEEARLKVYAARLKARERSKCKRQQSSCDGNNRYMGPSGQTQETVPKKLTIDENILTAAQHFLTAVKLEESKTSETEKPDLSLEKYMRPSASQLLYGIARDVRNTTSSLEEAKSTESMMGGLNLLATVSKYMNAESCSTAMETSVKEIAGHYQVSDAKPYQDCKILGKQDFNADISKDMGGEKVGEEMSEEAGDGTVNDAVDDEKVDTRVYTVKSETPERWSETESDDLPQIVSVLDMHKLEKKLVKKDVATENCSPPTSSCSQRLENMVPPDTETQHTGNPASKMKFLAIANVKLLSLPASPSSASHSSKLLRVIQSPVSQYNKVVSSVKANSTFSKKMLPHAIKLSPNKYLIPFSKPKSELSESGLIQTAQNTELSVSKDACLLPQSVLSNGACVTLHKSPSPTVSSPHFYTQSSSSGAPRTFTVKHSLPSASPDITVVSKNDISFPGRIVAQPCSQLHSSTNSQSVVTSSVETFTVSRHTSSPQVGMSSGGDTKIKQLTDNSHTMHMNTVISKQICDSGNIGTFTVKSPLASVPNNSNVKVDTSFPGRIIAEAHLPASNKLNLTTGIAASNQLPNKNIQVIKVTNTTSPLQLRSVSCMSGKTYIVLTSSANQSKNSQSVTSSPSHKDVPSSSGRILPFSEL